jgi:glucose-1-phosphate cytidylyltransferase
MQPEKTDLARVPVFVLCGGLGTRIKEETEFRPKPMVPVGSKPILWHILRSYAHFGFRTFVLCLGYKSDVIKSYFLNYSTMNSDLTVDLANDRLEVHSVGHEQDWKVTLADTGELSMTGSRVAQATSRYLGDCEHFAVTYGDGLTDANLEQEFAFHRSSGSIGTVLGVNPPSRFGELVTVDTRVLEFDEKPEFSDSWINGGFFFFRNEFVNYLSSSPDCILEREPLTRLARDGELSVFKHSGFWACMDTQRDREQLEEAWQQGNAPWRPEAIQQDVDRPCETGADLP